MKFKGEKMKKSVWFIILFSFFVSSVYSQDKTQDKKHDMIMESLGASSGSNLYLTFMMIGLLGDSYQKNMMDGENVIQNTKVVIAQSNVVRQYFEKMLEKKMFNTSDEPFARKIIYSYSLLQKEGNALIQYIETKDKKYVEEYHKNRELAKEQISQLLGLSGK